MVPRLLAITDREARSAYGLTDPKAFAGWLERLRKAGVDALQVREKHLGDRQLFELVGALRERWPAPRVLLVNGRVDVALAAGADGVHLPAAGLPIGALRRRFGERIVIGVSTHHPAEVAAAAAAGADYATFGPVFTTPSKMRYGAPPGLSGLRRAAEEGLGVVALGGVGPGEVGAVADAGGSGIAAIRALHDPERLPRLTAACRHAWAEERI